MGTNEGELLVGTMFIPRDRDVWVVERRHEDGEHWIEIQRHPTKAEAREGLERAARSGIDRDHLRVRRLDVDDVPSDDV